MTEDTSPQTKGIDTATAVDESTSGQSDTNQDKGTILGVDTDVSQPNHEHTESGGDRKATNDTLNDTPNDIPTSEGGKANGAGDATDAGVQLGTESEPKKKKKSKSKKKGAAARKGVTGFEEFYADAPMTPVEALKEKKEIYSKSRTFAGRIEECIQRYRANRRMGSERTMLFNKYLWLGGIDASQRQFTGFAEDREALAEADADEIRQMTATDFVGGSGSRFYESSESEHWFVDFEGIVKGFLSRIVPSIYMYDEDANKLAADLIKNFLNYVLIHDVCPEYDNDIKAAKQVCEIAPIELRMMHELLQELPGTFNSIAKELFYDKELQKCKGNIEGELYDKLVSFRVTVLTSAKKRIRKRLITSSDDPTTTRVISIKEETYQVVDICAPDPGGITVVEEELEAAGHKGKGKPAGLLLLKPSIIDHGFNNVLRSDQFDSESAEVEEYLLEGELLAKFEKGMKIKAVVCELDIGLRFIAKVKDVRVSFDQFLPQMLMEGWKDPVPNERPPPSASHPDAEDKIPLAIPIR
ncbi:Argonaute siRNA chaperone complex subunit Arb1-domain-containing protein [Annulohypoxylon bovei var. microspora]|nr:Argonaute siRNA chaperone complex subunit Arb1-domain-containing protein [Annulohypoxylon bovei var. microspora]